MNCHSPAPPAWRRSLVAGLALVLLPAITLAAANPPPLPAPQKSGGRPLLDTLAARATSRDFDPKDIPLQELSNLLWAAFGENRPDGRRTAPSAHNAQETEIYLLRRDGVWLYDAHAHALRLILAEDVRALGGQQPFVKDAPVTLVYVADLARLGSAGDREKTAYLDVGFVAENASLYCASARLATGVRMMIDRPALAPKLRLRDSQQIVLAQSVGYPKP
jgi:nitroreductase